MLQIQYKNFKKDWFWRKYFLLCTSNLCINNKKLGILSSFILVIKIDAAWLIVSRILEGTGRSLMK